MFNRRAEMNHKKIINEESEIMKSQTGKKKEGTGERKDNIGRNRLKQWIKRNRLCGGVVSARPYATYRAHTDGTTPEKVG